ncbi:MAG: hypothetical protein HRU35_02660 [Rickettsiaceae bacterium]|nr:hypothetical protein [Rickettsiaceae bacterium]
MINNGRGTPSGFLVPNDNIPNNVKQPDEKQILKKEYIDQIKFTGKHEYRNETGNLIGYVINAENKKDGSEFQIPVSWCYNIKTDSNCWVVDSFNDNGKVPIYGVEKLADSNKTVLIVGNEKAADGASKLLPEYDVISWLGDSKTAAMVDWNRLDGKNVIIWPDNEPAGIKAGQRISDQLHYNKEFFGMKVGYHLVDIKNMSLDKNWMNLSDPLPNGVKISNLKLLLNKAEIECKEFNIVRESESIKNSPKPETLKTNSELSPNQNHVSNEIKKVNSTTGLPDPQQNFAPSRSGR